MVANLIHMCIWQLQARGELACLVAQIGEAYKFVGGEEVPDTIREPPRNIGCVIGERMRGRAGLPPVRQSLWQVPVKERDVRRDIAFEQFVDDPIVIGEAFFVRLARPLGENTRPRDRESVASDSQVLKKPHVLFVEMV